MPSALPPVPVPPWHTEADTACREAAALRRRMTEGAWIADAGMRQADFFSAEVREYLPAPVTSRNAALNVWSQIATLYDDAPTVEAAGNPDLDGVITPDLWPMRQQSHLLQVAANECLIRIDIEENEGIGYRAVPVDTVVLRGYGKYPADRAPFNPTRHQPARVEECRLRLSPTGQGMVWTWEVWDVSDPGAPLFAIFVPAKTTGADGKEQDGWADATAHYAGEVGWPEQYRDAEGRPVLPYALYHRRVSDRLLDPLTGAELVNGTLDASALWTFWMSAVRDGSHPQRYIMDGHVPATANTSGGVSRLGTDAIRASPQFILPIHGIRRGEEYTSPNAGQWQPAADPASLATSIEGYEAGLAVSAGLSPADVHRGTSAGSGYALVVSQKGKRDMQKKLIPPSRSGDQVLLAKAAALLRDPALPIDPAAWSITYGMIGVSPEEILKEQQVIKEDLALRLTSHRAAIRTRNPSMTEAQIDALIAEIDGVEADDGEDMPDDDAVLTDLLTRALAADPAEARTLTREALDILGADVEEDAAEEAPDAAPAPSAEPAADAEDTPPGSDDAS